MGTLQKYFPQQSPSLLHSESARATILPVQPEVLHDRTSTHNSTIGCVMEFPCSKALIEASGEIKRTSAPAPQLRLGSGLLLRDCPSANAPHRRGSLHSAVYTSRISCPQLGSRVHLFMLVVALTPPNRPR